MMPRPIFVPLLTAALLCGCSTPEGAFPSLARRPFEQNVTPSPGPVPARAIASRLPGAMGSKVEAWQARHQKASSAFSLMLQSARLAAQNGRSAAEGSEDWVKAQLMLSRLDNARSDAVTVLAEMDDLISRQTDAESASSEPLISPLLNPIRADMGAAVEQQDREISSLSEIIG